jgi:hypothetical protein
MGTGVRLKDVALDAIFQTTLPVPPSCPLVTPLASFFRYLSHPSTNPNSNLLLKV